MPWFSSHAAEVVKIKFLEGITHPHRIETCRKKYKEHQIITKRANISCIRRKHPADA